MGFFRRRRRPQLDLAALDRLSDTIARAVSLIEERLAPSESREEPRRRAELVIRREPDWREPQRREPEPPEPELRPEPAPAPEPEPEPPAEPAREAPAATGFVLFVPTSAGYRLTAPNGVAPEPGERVRVEDDWYRVVRLGPSPLPGDPRRCVFLELQLATLEE